MVFFFRPHQITEQVIARLPAAALNRGLEIGTQFSDALLNLRPFLLGDGGPV